MSSLFIFRLMLCTERVLEHLLLVLTVPVRPKCITGRGITTGLVSVDKVLLWVYRIIPLRKEVLHKLSLALPVIEQRARAALSYSGACFFLFKANDVGLLCRFDVARKRWCFLSNEGPRLWAWCYHCWVGLLVPGQKAADGDLELFQKWKPAAQDGPGLIHASFRKASIRKLGGRHGVAVRFEGSVQMQRM